MEKKVRMICGEQVKVAVYNGKMRFMVQGSYYMLTPQNIEHYNAVRDKMHIHCNPDGSADITAAAIVSWDLPDNLLQEYADIMLNEIEIALRSIPATSARLNGVPDTRTRGGMTFSPKKRENTLSNNLWVRRMRTHI